MAGILAAALGGAALALTFWTVLAYEAGLGVAIFLTVAILAVLAILRHPTAGVVLALLAVPFEYLAADVGGGSFGLTPSEGILIVTAVAAGPRLVTNISLEEIPTPLYVFAGLVAVSMTGLFFAVDTFTVARITLMWIAFGSVALYISQRPASEIWAIGATLAISGGILGAMALGNISDQQAISGGAIVTNRAQASFAHPTALALFLILTFPTALALALGGPKQLRWLMALASALALVGLMLTQTRGSVVGAAAALLWMLRWRPFRRLTATVLAILALAVLLDVGSLNESQPVTVFSERLDTLVSLRTRSDDRLEIWATTPSIIAEHPLLGVGQGNFPSASPNFGLADVGGVAFDHAHNLFLNVAAELGLIGLALLVLFLVTLATSARAALAHRESKLYPLALAASASLLGVLVNSLTEYPVRQNLIMATAMICVGILLATMRLARR